MADPIEPVDKLDKRPAVKDLIQEHRSAIDAVAKELKSDALFDPSKHDDLWILRFVLSHCKSKKKTTDKTLAKAAAAAKATLVFRKEHKLDDEDLRAHVPSARATHPLAKDMSKYLSLCADDAMVVCIPDRRRGPVSFIQYMSIDQEAVVEQMDESRWMPAFLFPNEFLHQWLDYTTRTTGRLTKNVRLVGMEGAKLGSVNSEHERRNSKAMSVMEDCYPQLLQAIFVCDPPTWILASWRLVKVFFPKRVKEKFDFISPKANEKERRTLLKYISKENLPSKFGGERTEWPVQFPLPDM